MANKYEPLKSHLRSIPVTIQEVSLSFSEIEQILGVPLPESASKHRAWWGNQRNSNIHRQAHAWLSAGFLVDSVNQSGSNRSVRFKRQGAPRPAAPSLVCDTVRTSQSRISEPASGKTQGHSYRREHVPTVFLVSCVSAKLPNLAPARDLYVSDWFRKARAYVESTGMPWFILSAEYGLLEPSQPTAPYEKTLNTMSIRERTEWAQRVVEQMNTRLPDAERIVVFAGERYRKHIVEYLRRRFSEVEVPLKGLRIGEQLHWFLERLRNEST